MTPVALLLAAGCGDAEGPSAPPELPEPPVIDSALTLAFAHTTEGQMQGILHVVFSGQDLGWRYDERYDGVNWSKGTGES